MNFHQLDEKMMFFATLAEKEYEMMKKAEEVFFSFSAKYIIKNLYERYKLKGDVHTLMVKLSFYASFVEAVFDLTEKFIKKIKAKVTSSKKRHFDYLVLYKIPILGESMFMVIFIFFSDHYIQIDEPFIKKSISQILYRKKNYISLYAFYRGFNKHNFWYMQEQCDVSQAFKLFDIDFSPNGLPITFVKKNIPETAAKQKSKDLQ